MSATLMLWALGTLPCLPLGSYEPPEDEASLRGFLLPDPDQPRDPIPPIPPPAPPVKPPVAVAPPRHPDEASHFRVVYGLFGELGQIDISFAFPGELVKAVGTGAGSFLGIGQFEKRLESQLDARALTSRRWVSTRVQSGKTITDSAEQATPGTIDLVRRRTDKPDEGHHFVRKQAVLDPLGFLFSLRTRPPTAKQTYEVIDARALWIITLEAAQPARLEDGRATLALRGHADPIFWDGRPDSERSARDFTLWLDDDADRAPVRLVMPLALGEVRVDRAGLERTAPADSPASKVAGTAGPPLAEAAGR